MPLGIKEGIMRIQERRFQTQKDQYAEYLENQGVNAYNAFKRDDVHMMPHRLLEIDTPVEFDNPYGAPELAERGDMLDVTDLANISVVKKDDFVDNYKMKLSSAFENQTPKYADYKANIGSSYQRLDASESTKKCYAKFLENMAKSTPEMFKTGKDRADALRKEFGELFKPATPPAYQAGYNI